MTLQNLHKKIAKKLQQTFAANVFNKLLTVDYLLSQVSCRKAEVSHQQVTNPAEWEFGLRADGPLKEKRGYVFTRW